VRAIRSGMWVEWADLWRVRVAPPYRAALSPLLLLVSAAVGSGFLVVILLVCMRYLPVLWSMEGDLGRGLWRAVLLGACAVSPYNVHPCLMRPVFHVFAGVGLYTHVSGGKKSFWRSGNFIGMVFFGLEISLGWRKAEYRIAAPRGPVFGHN
jgi:hypothetical protein